MEGTTRLQDFQGNTLQVLTSYNTCNFWFCCLDVSAESRMVVTGDNAGHVIQLNMDGREVHSREPESSLSIPYPQPQFSAPT